MLPFDLALYIFIYSYLFSGWRPVSQRERLPSRRCRTFRTGALPGLPIPPQNQSPT